MSTESTTGPGRSDPELDLLVIGGGAGGFAAAIAASEQGRRVGIVNTGPLGGTCTNRGCIPSKTLIRAAEVWWRSGHHRYAGLETATIGMEHVARAQVVHDLCGLVKLVADRDTGRLLGAHLVSGEAGEVIQTATLAVKTGLTIDDLAGTLFPYLTYSEALRLAAVSFDKDLDRLSCCA